ncbi:MAG: zinc transporter ZntB [Rhodospirillales bacterium]
MLNFTIQAGIEPGLRFASVLDGQGGCIDLDWDGVRTWNSDRGFLWIHLEQDTPEAEEWITGRSGLDPLVAEALLAEDSRPRVEAFDDGLLLILRGINLAEKDEVELVPVHIWVDSYRLISLREKTHALNALRDIRLALKAGRGPRTAGGLLVQVTEKTARDMEPVLDEMNREIEDLEDRCIRIGSAELRQTLAEVRRSAIHLRRYLGPQRDALYRLRNEDTPILNERDRLRLRGTIDRVVRHIEDLDAFRDRTLILHEDLTAQLSEKIAQTSNRLTGLAALLLPPGIIAGMLGANIGGIPGQDDPYAFLELMAVVIVIVFIQWLVLRRMRWL